jgi:hypothetical protein
MTQALYAHMNNKRKMKKKLLCWVGVHCGIYKSSYILNISLEFTLPLFSFISPPHSTEQFQQVSFFSKTFLRENFNRGFPVTACAFFNTGRGSPVFLITLLMRHEI